MKVKIDLAHTVGFPQMFLIFFVKLIISFLRVVVFPLGLVWLGVNMLRKAVYDKYPV